MPNTENRMSDLVYLLSNNFKPENIGAFNEMVKNIEKQTSYGTQRALKNIVDFTDEGLRALQVDMMQTILSKFTMNEKDLKDTLNKLLHLKNNPKSPDMIKMIFDNASVTSVITDYLLQCLLSPFTSLSPKVQFRTEKDASYVEVIAALCSNNKCLPTSQGISEAITNIGNHNGCKDTLSDEIKNIIILLGTKFRDAIFREATLKCVKKASTKVADKSNKVKDIFKSATDNLESKIVKFNEMFGTNMLLSYVSAEDIHYKQFIRDVDSISANDSTAHDTGLTNALLCFAAKKGFVNVVKKIVDNRRLALKPDAITNCIVNLNNLDILTENQTKIKSLLEVEFQTISTACTEASSEKVGLPLYQCSGFSIQ